MVLTRWADTSEHNDGHIDRRYKRPWYAFRANDGTYIDNQVDANLSFAEHYKRLIGFIVYMVWPRSQGWSSWQETFETLKSLLGNKHRPRLVLMNDVETWSRTDLYDDFSGSLEELRRAQVAWLHSLRPRWQRIAPFKFVTLRRDNRRVIGYGNRSDLEKMAGDSNSVKWRWIVLADYTPGLPIPKSFNGWRVVGVQHTNGVIGDTPHGTAPFGNCDMNVSNFAPHMMARKLGLGPVRKPKPTPPPHPNTKRTFYIVKSGDSLSSIAASHHTTWRKLQRLNHLHNPNRIYVGQKLRIR